MFFTRPAVVLAALVLLVAGCGDGGDQAADDTTAGTEQTADGASAELDDDVAAVVNGEEISAASVDQQVDALVDNPQIVEQMGDEEEARGLLGAEVLSAAIQTRLVLDGAEELDRPVTDDDIAETRAELEERMGGADALEAMISEQQLTDENVDEQLRAMAAVRNIEAVFAEEVGEDTTTTETAPSSTAPGDQQPMSPSEQAAQEFLTQQLAEADVVVNDDYGTWNPQTARVTPPGGAPTAPPMPPAGSGGGGGGTPEPNVQTPDDGS